MGMIGWRILETIQQKMDRVSRVEEKIWKGIRSNTTSAMDMCKGVNGSERRMSGLRDKDRWVWGLVKRISMGMRGEGNG